MSFKIQYKMCHEYLPSTPQGLGALSLDIVEMKIQFHLEIKLTFALIICAQNSSGIKNKF